MQIDASRLHRIRTQPLCALKSAQEHLDILDGHVQKYVDLSTPQAAKDAAFQRLTILQVRSSRTCQSLPYHTGGLYYDGAAPRHDDNIYQCVLVICMCTYLLAHACEGGRAPRRLHVCHLTGVVCIHVRGQVLLCKLIDLLDSAKPWNEGPMFDVEEEPRVIPRDVR